VTPRELLEAAQVLGEKITAHQALVSDYARERAEVLRELNGIPGWTQRRIADELGVTQTAISHAINSQTRRGGQKLTFSDQPADPADYLPPQEEK
jgi:DNA-binding MarR family transcriptional regulator